MTNKDSNKSKILNSLSQTNWKAIVFFTSFTAMLWLILQFTKIHNASYELSIEFTEIPVKEVLSKEVILLPITIQETGFALFKKRFSENNIRFPLSALEKKDSVYLFQSSLFETQIGNQLDLPLEKFSIKSKEFVIPFTTKTSKKVPIHTYIEVNYVKSYASYRGVVISQDSIDIAGPVDKIDQISEIETEKLKLNYIKTNKVGSIPLVNPFSDAVVLSFDKVDYSIQVDKFTEQSFRLPIQLKNPPENFTVELIPDQITLKFQSSLEEMENISEEDFLVECDFESALSSVSVLIPKLVNQPKKAIRIQLEPNRVEYMLRK